jgi:hypothetical protein
MPKLQSGRACDPRLRCRRELRPVPGGDKLAGAVLRRTERAGVLDGVTALVVVIARAGARRASLDLHTTVTTAECCRRWIVGVLFDQCFLGATLFANTIEGKVA